MTFRRVDLGMIPACVARINYSGDLGYELWVAPEYQRELFDRIVAAGEPHGMRLFGMRALMSLRLEKSLRHVVPRVPADLHAARGRDHPLPQARPRVHRARRARGRAGDRWPGAAARDVRRRARPRRSGRRHRRRADLARRRGRRLGDVGRLRPPRQGDRSRSATCRPRWRRRTAPAAPGSRSRSSAGDGLRACSRSRCSTRRAPGCANDRRRGDDRCRPDRRRRAAGRVRAGRLGGGRDPARRRASRATAARCAWPATAATAWPRWTASPTSGRARRRRARAWWCVRHPAVDMPPLPVVRPAGPRVDAGGRARSRFGVSRSTSSVVGWRRRGARGGGRGATGRAERRSCSTPATATRSWRSTPGPTVIVRTAPTGCSTCTPTRWSWPPAPPSSSRSARATTWRGS